jgi:PAS domain S-box-containing protein
VVNKENISWKILLFINLLIVAGAIIVKVADPLMADYTEAIRKADFLNFVIFTPIIMAVLSILVYRSLKPIRAFTRSDIMEPGQLQEIRTASFNLPLKITEQLLLIVISGVAFVGFGVDSYFFKFYPLSERFLSMSLIWTFTICTSLAVYVYTRHKMIDILKATSGTAEDIGFRMPINARFMIMALTLSVMVFIFTYIFAFSRINDILWHDSVQAGSASLMSFKKTTTEFDSRHKLREYLESKSLAENMFVVDSGGKYLTRKPSIIPDTFDIKSCLLADPEGTVKITKSPAAALRVLPLEGPFKGLYAGTVIRLNSDPAKESKIRYLFIFFPVMGCYLLVFTAIISYYVAHDTSSAVRDVARQMVKIQDTKGALYAEVKVTSLDEVGDLTRAFNNLQRILNTYHQNLNEANRKLIEMERIRADNAVHDYRLLAENITDVIFTVDLNQRLTYVSPSIQRLRGYSREESAGQGIQEWFTEDSLRAVTETSQEVIKRAASNPGGRFMSRSLELKVTRQGGPIVWAEASIDPLLNPHGHPIGVLYILRDITERKRMEEEMLKAQKLESLGVLAGGIAHDFNNLLTSVIGNLSLMEFYAESGEDIAELLEETKKASLQTKHLTQQLLTFSKGGEPIRKQVPISKLIESAAKFFLSGSNIKYTLFTPDDLWGVEIDEGQINQVMNNLLINAEQAMPKGGKIEMFAENVIVRDIDGLPLKEGNYVKISIRDYGAGIPEELLDKIFDPYFSTKPKGSGLGLAITYSIMKKHKGHIMVESQLGVGTTFHLYFPAVEKIIPTQDSVHHHEEKPHPGKGTILFMDDQSEIRKLAGRMLKLLGYEVEFASNGEEAISLYKKALESKEAFDAVILDLTIPGGMGGKETIQKLREIDPGVRAIVSSGYSNDTIMSDYKQYGFSGVVAKPYETGELEKVLSRVIQEAGK